MASPVTVLVTSCSKGKEAGISSGNLSVEPKLQWNAGAALATEPHIFRKQLLT